LGLAYRDPRAAYPGHTHGRVAPGFKRLAQEDRVDKVDEVDEGNGEDHRNGQDRRGTNTIDPAEAQSPGSPALNG
jgi:hypothetical protein